MNLLKAAGVAIPEFRVATTKEEAVKAAEEISE